MRAELWGLVRTEHGSSTIHCTPSIHDSTISKRLGKNGIHGKVPRQKPLQTKKKAKAHLTFAKKLLNFLPRLLGKYFVDWCDKSWTYGMCVCPVISGVKPTPHFIKRTSYQVKHGGGSVMVWGCFAASGPGRLAIIDGIMNSALHKKILKENVWPSASDLKLKRTWVMQQDIDLKHTASPPLIGSIKTKLRFWSGQVKVQT